MFIKATIKRRKAPSEFGRLIKEKLEENASLNLSNNENEDDKKKSQAKLSQMIRKKRIQQQTKNTHKRSQVKRFPAESGIQGCLPAYAFADRPLSN